MDNCHVVWTLNSTNIDHLHLFHRLSESLTHVKGVTSSCLLITSRIALPQPIYTWQAGNWLVCVGSECLVAKLTNFGKDITVPGHTFRKCTQVRIFARSICGKSITFIHLSLAQCTVTGALVKYSSCGNTEWDKCGLTGASTLLEDLPMSASSRGALSLSFFLFRECLSCKLKRVELHQVWPLETPTAAN